MSYQSALSILNDLINTFDNISLLNPVLITTHIQQQSQINDNNLKKKKMKKKNKKKKIKTHIASYTNRPKPRRPRTILTETQLPISVLKNGQKSTLFEDIQSKYNPFQVECLWNQWWQQRKYYKANSKNSTKENFVMIMFPSAYATYFQQRFPVEHAFVPTVEDCITRYWRMKGKNCLWLPSTGYGNYTAKYMERDLARNGQTKHNLGRKHFIEKVLEFEQKNATNICGHLRRMGCSVDWSRYIFAFDTKISDAVTEAFVRLHEKGLIYRDYRLCHWSFALQSTVAVVEMDKIEIRNVKYFTVPGYDKKVKFGVKHRFGYKLVRDNKNMDEIDEIVMVDTTRLQTMLGAVAIVIHPKLDRYKHLHGRYVQHPFIDRKLPIICDTELPIICYDIESYGTGCVQIAPAHNVWAFEWAKRFNNQVKVFEKTVFGFMREHCGSDIMPVDIVYLCLYFVSRIRKKLDFVNVYTKDGNINDNGGKFQGMKRFECRDCLIEELKKLSLYFGEQPITVNLDVCCKSKDILEPFLKAQWYMNCDHLATHALDAVFKDKTINFIPKKDGEREWKTYLQNIRRWCVSRQAWWGHRIPAWYIQCESHSFPQFNWIIARNQEDAIAIADVQMQTKYGQRAKQIKYKLIQDEDVLDSWFVIALYPFASLGWPKNTIDLQKFFPGDLVTTSLGQLFYWVARMVMMSLALMETVPFHTVYIRSTVKRPKGGRWSSSRNPSIDAMKIIEGLDGNVKHGADSLRFGLLTQSFQRTFVANTDVITGYRLFCNKIWQSTKFVLSHLKNATPMDDVLSNSKNTKMSVQWILCKLDACIKQCDLRMQRFEFAEATSCVYQFFCNEFCSIYLEIIKVILYSEDEEKKMEQQMIRNVLYFVLSTIFKLMHPFMPFITEELFQRIQKARLGDEYKIGDKSIMMEPYPSELKLSWSTSCVEIEQTMKLLTNLSAKIRSVKQALGFSTKIKYDVLLKVNEDNNVVSKSMLNDICTLSICKSIAFVGNNFDKKKYFSDVFHCKTTKSSIYIYHDISEVINTMKMIKKLNKQVLKLNKFIKKATKTVTVMKSYQKRIDKIQTRVQTVKQNALQLENWIEQIRNIHYHRCEIIVFGYIRMNEKKFGIMPSSITHLCVKYYFDIN